MQQPPLLPEETLARVTRIARFDGMMVVALGGVSAVFAAVGGNAILAVLGLVAAAAGAIELHGEGLLRHGEPRGITWLIASQPMLLAAIIVYCGFRVWYFPLPPLPDLPDQMRDNLGALAEKAGMSVDAYLGFANRLWCAIIAGVAVIYQGWMTIYYYNRRHAVARALGEE